MAATNVWQYIQAEGFPIVPLHLAELRPVVQRGGQWLMVDDDRYPFAQCEVAQMRSVRFRTLGCWPLTAVGIFFQKQLQAVGAKLAWTIGL